MRAWKYYALALVFTITTTATLLFTTNYIEQESLAERKEMLETQEQRRLENLDSFKENLFIQYVTEKHDISVDRKMISFDPLEGYESITYCEVRTEPCPNTTTDTVIIDDDKKVMVYIPDEIGSTLLIPSRGIPRTLPFFQQVQSVFEQNINGLDTPASGNPNDMVVNLISKEIKLRFHLDVKNTLLDPNHATNIPLNVSKASQELSNRIENLSILAGDTSLPEINDIQELVDQRYRQEFGPGRPLILSSNARTRMEIGMSISVIRDKSPNQYSYWTNVTPRTEEGEYLHKRWMYEELLTKIYYNLPFNLQDLTLEQEETTPQLLEYCSSLTGEECRKKFLEEFDDGHICEGLEEDQQEKLQCEVEKNSENTCSILKNTTKPCQV